MPRQDFYADALLYDILHETGTRAETSCVLALAHRFCTGKAAIARGERAVFLEPACGSGRYLRELARRGHASLGIDMSPAMVRFAVQSRAELPARARPLLRAVCARMESFPAPRVRAHAAFNLINSIRHVGSDAAMTAHLACVRRALRPGGVYIVGMGLCAYGIEDPTEDTWQGSRRVGTSKVHVSQVVQYLPAPADGARSRAIAKRSEQVISHLTVTTKPIAGMAGKERGNQVGERHVDSVYRLRCYNLAQWRLLIARAGWDVLATTDQDAKPVTPHEPGYFVWVLRPKA